MSILIKDVILDNKKKDIYIEDNLIQEINDKIGVEAEYKINGKNKAAIPGLVNAHTHAAMTLLRGYADDMRLQEWLENKIWPLEAKLSEEDVYVGTKLACLEMIKSGTTFFNDMYWHWHGIAKAVEESGIRAAISAVFIDMFDEEKAEEQKRLNVKLFRESKNYSSRIMFTLGPHAIYTVSEDSLVWAKEFADKHHLLIHIHLSETKREVEECIKRHKLRPVEYLHKIGFLGANVIAAHSVWLNDREIGLLKKHAVNLVYNPTSNMKLAVGSALPYKKLKDINVYIGTDGCASNNNLDMFEEMKFATLLQKFYTNEQTILPAEEIFRLATNAEIFNLNTGKIEEGKIADLILINLKKVELVPMHNLISNLVYAANGSCVDTTICDGKILMLNRNVPWENDIIAKVKEVIKKILE